MHGVGHSRPVPQSIQTRAMNRSDHVHHDPGPVLGAYLQWSSRGGPGRARAEQVATSDEEDQAESERAGEEPPARRGEGDQHVLHPADATLTGGCRERVETGTAKDVTLPPPATYRRCVSAVPTSWPTRRGLREERSFVSVAEEHLDDVYRYLLYMTGNPHTAEDLAAETFERALRRWRRFDPRRASARTWLCQLARSTALDHFRAEQRRRKRDESYAREIPALDEPVFGDGLSPALDAAVRSLSAGEREVVVLRVVLELDGDTTARVLGIRPTAVSTRLSRALQKLEERMVSDVRG
jgi:RNA polymerase sigma-70 factor (ECF subfamily)